MSATLVFILRRVLQVIPVVLAIAALNFVLLHLAPGDAAEIIAARSGGSDVEFVAQLRREFGLDQPVYLQFFYYIGRLLMFDLGWSNVQHAPVIDLIVDRVPATLLLMLTSIVIAIGGGILLGIVAALRHRSWLDNVVSVAALVVYATPQFWLGLMLVVLFSISFGLLPSNGMMTIATEMSAGARFVDIARHLILPSVTLGLFYVAVYARLMRASMLEVFTLDFITTARAKGLSEARIGIVHAARNALLPVVTLAGVQVGHLLGGSILVETVFGWPGLGRLVFDALLQRDLNLLLGILFISSIVVVVANLAVDLIYGLLDPRIVHR